MSRRLVLTADDVGVDRAAVDAVVDLVRAGRLSAASIIPMAPWARYAVAALSRFIGPGGSLSLGLHSTFTTAELGWGAWGPWSGGPSLIRPGGGFYPDVARFASAADPGEVVAELRAQTSWFDASGVRPTHLDSHHGALYGIEGPHFLFAAVKVCAERSLALRLPRTLPTELGALRPGLIRGHRDAIALADDLGVRVPETIGTDWRPPSRIAGYEDLRDSYFDTIRRLPEGVSEIFLHPAPARAQDAGQEDAKRAWEHRLLRDDALGELLVAEGVEIVTWPANRPRTRQGPPGSAGQALSSTPGRRQR